MKNIQIPLMFYTLSLLPLSRSQSTLQTISSTNYSLHFTHIRSQKFVKKSSHSCTILNKKPQVDNRTSMRRNAQQQHWGGDIRRSAMGHSAHGAQDPWGAAPMGRNHQ